IEELLQLFKNASLEFSGTNWEKYLIDANGKELSTQEKDANWVTMAGDDCIKEWCATGEEIYLSKIRLLPFEIPALASYHGIPATLQAVYESYETLVPEMSERQVVSLTHCMRVAEMLQPGDAWETCRRKLDEALEHRKTEEGRVYFKPHITDIYEACFRAPTQTKTH
ncbi:MAG: hypothetical protein Q4B34_03035, partial [Candidatus Saccharibacteria bacterium]|nr:hypothetical protein [Candidatus Saccharibacteria bacterium]